MPRMLLALAAAAAILAAPSAAIAQTAPSNLARAALAATDAATARLGSSGRENADAVKRLGAAAQSLQATSRG